MGDFTCLRRRNGGGAHGSCNEDFHFAGSDNLSDVGNCAEFDVPGTVAAATLKANSIGLFELCGSVWQWCIDSYDYWFYQSGPENDPVCQYEAAYKSLRGGSWDSDAFHCRVASRDFNLPETRTYDTGFRVAVSLLLS